MLSVWIMKKPPFSINDAHKISIHKLAQFYVRCKDAYYNSSKPLVDDDTFDALENILKQRSPHHKVLELIGATKTTDDKVVLPFWMGSQDKIYPEDTKAFQKWKKYVGDTDAIASAKLDGLSSILIVSSKSTQLLSRGDGKHAKDWTHHLQYMSSLHNSIQILQEWIHKHKTIQKVILRGEAIMSKKHFNALKKKQQWTSSARNIVSGLLNGKSSDAEVLKYVDIVFYEVVEPVMTTFLHQLDFLQQFKFTNVAHSLGKSCNASVLSNTFELVDLEPLFWNNREQCPFMTDGVVVQSNTYHTRNISANPKYAFAFKIRVNDASQTAQTTVKDIVWNVSRHGYLIPTILLEPVTISNVKIRKTTGFHYKFIVDNNIGKGTVVKLRRCGDVIPNVVDVVESTKAIFPPQPYTLTETGVDAMITDASQVDAFVIEQLTHFFKVMEVPHMSEKTVQRCVEHGYRDVFQILNLKVDTLLEWDGFSHKSSQQLVQNMYECTRKADALQWIHGGAVFGRGIGKKHIQTLLKQAPMLFDTQPMTSSQNKQIREHLLSLNGYQDKTVNILLEHHSNFIVYWQKVKQHMGKSTPVLLSENNTHNTNSTNMCNTRNDLIGMTFCFSGVRDKEFQKQLETRGASFVTTVSKTVNVLICNTLDATSAKMVKARQLLSTGTPIQIITLIHSKQIYGV